MAEDKVEPHTDYNAFLYITSTPNFWGNIQGLANVDSVCTTDYPVAYVDAVKGGSDGLHLTTLSHELAHILGGIHIEDYTNFYNCWCYPKQCILGRGECHKMITTIYNNVSPT